MKHPFRSRRSTAERPPPAAEGHDRGRPTDSEPGDGEATDRRTATFSAATATSARPPTWLPASRPTPRPGTGPARGAGEGPDSGDRTRDETVTDEVRLPGLLAHAVSTIGLRHVADSQPRQDSVAVAVSHDRLVAAVADGVSAATCSDIGSQIAVDTAVQVLTTDPDGLDDVVGEVHAALLHHAARQRLAPADLATTLIAAVIAPSDDGGLLLRSVGVGDSGIGVHLETGWRTVASDRGDGLVDALPLHPHAAWERSSVIPPGCALLLATDGITDEVLPRHLAVWGEQLQHPCGLADTTRLVCVDAPELGDDRTAVLVWPTPPHDHTPTIDPQGDPS